MSRPTADRLADQAHHFQTQWKSDASWTALQNHALSHLTRWPGLLGATVVERLDLARDGAPLLEEAARALAIKAAANALADDDLPGALPVAIPVEEAVHALTAHRDLLWRITHRTGIRLIQLTHTTALAYRPGCLTYDTYCAAWGEPPARYWLDHDTARQYHLLRLYTATDLKPGSHNITFSPPQLTPPLATPRPPLHRLQGDQCPPAPHPSPTTTDS